MGSPSCNAGLARSAAFSPTLVPFLLPRSSTLGSLILDHNSRMPPRHASEVDPDVGAWVAADEVLALVQGDPAVFVDDPVRGLHWLASETRSTSHSA